MRHYLIALLLTSTLSAQSTQRPHLLGVAHAAFRVADVPTTASFYQTVLGYQEPFALQDANGSVAMKFVKVNDQQYVELMPGTPKIHGQLDHFALYTDDLTAMHDYLRLMGVEIVRDIHAGRIGNPFLTVRDPDGHLIEILQYAANSQTARARGKFIPDSRISSHITHVGILINSVGTSLKFYRDILGFRESARGGGTAGQPDWVTLRIPDGTDYVELIPFSGVASPDDLRATNHLGLSTSDVQKSVATLQTRALAGSLSHPVTLQSGGNLPLRANILDPDGARIELMGVSPDTKSSVSAPSP